MKTFVRVLLALAAALVVVGGIAYVDGMTLPVEHTASVTGIVPATQSKIFTLIASPAAAPTWRPAVKSVKVLLPDNGRDHWVEDLGHGQTMTFLATRSDPPVRREVLLDVPGAAYGGSWTYELSPGPSPNTTALRVTETGFIHPALYRFMMQHVFGMSHNLNQYMADLQTAAPKL